MRFEEIDARIRSSVDAVAASDPNPTDPFRGLYISDDAARALARVTPSGGMNERIATVSRMLELDALEADVLALCAAPELSPRYGRLLAYLHDDVTRKLASPRLVARMLADDDRSPEDVIACFARDARLRRVGAVRLLDSDPSGPLADRLIKVADRLAAELLGARLDSSSVESRMRRLDLDPQGSSSSDGVVQLRRAVALESSMPVLVAGPEAPQVLARAVERGLLMVDVQVLFSPDELADATVTAHLEARALCFVEIESLSRTDGERLSQAIALRAERPLLCARARDGALRLGDTPMLVIETSLPTFAEREAHWHARSGVDNVADLAAKFRLSHEQIGGACEIARLRAAGRGSSVESEDLHAGARQASSSRLGELATRVPAAFAWQDLVLPARQLELLRSISAYLRHRDLVLSEWGYAHAVARDQGLKVLFAGESGTGKTMAAQVLARALGLELYRIDLATVVSKYIGETEKNLDHIFVAAEGSNAILFFDEADALFGKRSEVSDAHDRYANIEVAYLLQKMDSYSGAVVLATNLRRNVDDAFLRRLDFVVDFPFPEPADRERIWRLLLPASAPLAEELDVAFLANQFKLSGGGIRNCSLAAAFLAADDGGVITMEHLVRAVAIEYGKLGRLTLEADFQRFHAAIRERV